MRSSSSPQVPNGRIPEYGLMPGEMAETHIPRGQNDDDDNVSIFYADSALVDRSAHNDGRRGAGTSTAKH